MGQTLNIYNTSLTDENDNIFKVLERHCEWHDLIKGKDFKQDRLPLGRVSKCKPLKYDKEVLIASLQVLVCSKCIPRLEDALNCLILT